MKSLLPALCLPLLAAASGLAQDNDRHFEGRHVITYTKEWHGDYGGDFRDTFQAYHEVVKLPAGHEITVEVPHGKYVSEFGDTGKARAEGIYRDGLRDGPFTMWAGNGTKTDELPYVKGKLHGVYSQWHHDGTPIRTETYRAGVLEGETRWFTRGGKLLSTGSYRDGKPWEGRIPERITEGEAAAWFVATYREGKKVGTTPINGDWWWP